MKILTPVILIILGLLSNVYASDIKPDAHVFQREGHSFYELSLYRYSDKQIVTFNGSFGDAPFRPAKNFLKKLEKGKEVHLYIERGRGGSVSQHKRFIRDIKKACTKGSKKVCQVVTYLDGQCSSMCITLFLSGDKRFARDHWFANLGFHRTVLELNGRYIPIQSVNSMVRYFSEFEGVDDNYLKRNKDIIFGQANNGLYQAKGQELIDAGFAHDFSEVLDGTKETFLKSFQN